ncbi:hypothetical protein ABIC28_002625 [Rhodococcus sp. PvR044]
MCKQELFYLALEVWWHALATFGMDGYLDFNGAMREQFTVPSA